MKFYTTSEYMNNEISFRLVLFACPLQIRQYFLDNIFLTLCFYGVIFFNSNLNNLFESSSIEDFLVDFSVDFLIGSLMFLCISSIALKILKSSSSGS